MKFLFIEKKEVQNEFFVHSAKNDNCSQLCFVDNFTNLQDKLL